ncbi:hypothetical protein FACS1894133_3830 [Clostridia bacterium]|nr:hypothetical protein FACS1894133_3830 [Clostridia bacterium]
MNNKPVETFIKTSDTDTGFRSVAARIFLVCLCCAGFGLYFAVTYKVPAPSPAMFGLLGLVFGIVFSILPIIADGKLLALLVAAVAVLSPFVFLNELKSLSKAFYWFGNYMLNIIDSERFATKSLAVPLSSIIGDDAAVSGVCLASVLVFALVCFLFCVGGRARGIGIILLVTIVFAAPAFAANLAGYSFGVELLLAGMFGLYIMWTMCGSVPTPETEKTALLGRFSGTLPPTRMFGRTAVCASVAAFVCIFATSKFITYSNFYDSKFQQVITELSDKLSQTFGLDARLNDNSYFVQSKYDAGGSLGTRPPSLSKRKIIEITAEDNAPLYLKGDIGYDYENDSWTTNSGTKAFYTLSNFAKDYYPEVKYLSFKRRLETDGYNANEVFGEENVVLEYLINTKMVFIPTMPSDFTYKNNELLYSDKDTILRVNSDTTYIGKFNMRVTYPKIWDSNLWADIYDKIQHEGALAEVLVGLPASYEKISQYESLLPAVYSGIPDSERENIAMLSDILDTYGGNNSDVTTFRKLISAEQYFKTQYNYSLNADNLKGGNTVLGNFLFNTKSGHCALYATAFTLYARSLGLPARYVTGYVAREFTKTDDGYTCTIRENNAHAWVEVYLDEIGWLPFDPTPDTLDTSGTTTTAVTSEATTAVAAETTVVTATDTATATAANTAEPVPNTTVTESSNTGTTEYVNKDDTPTSPMLWLPVYILLAGGAVFTIIVGVNKLEQRAVSIILARGNSRATTSLMYKLLSFAQLIPMAGETPLAFAKRVDNAAICDMRLCEVMVSIEQNEFGYERMSGVEYEQVCAYVRKLHNRKLTFRQKISIMFDKFGR